MFSVGDKVVYPMHGVGIIEKIEDRQVLGQTRQYFIIQIIKGRMQVMVPLDGCEGAGLRGVSSKDAFKAVFETLSSESTPMDDNWNRRNRENMEKLKTGDLLLIAEVIRNLVRIDRIKKLSTGEKKMLSNAKLIMASEMEVALNVSEEAALEKIENSI